MKVKVKITTTSGRVYRCESENVIVRTRGDYLKVIEYEKIDDQKLILRIKKDLVESVDYRD